MYELLFDNRTTDGISAVVFPQRFIESQFVIAQVEFAGTSSDLIVQGRVSPDFGWVEIHSFDSADGAVQAQQVTAFPEMRLEVDNCSSCDVTAALAS